MLTHRKDVIEAHRNQPTQHSLAVRQVPAAQRETSGEQIQAVTAAAAIESSGSSQVDYRQIDLRPAAARQAPSTARQTQTGMHRAVCTPAALPRTHCRAARVSPSQEVRLRPLQGRTIAVVPRSPLSSPRQARRLRLRMAPHMHAMKLNVISSSRLC